MHKQCNYFSQSRVRWMREVGLINRIKTRWLTKKPKCEGGSRDFTAVGLREIKPVFHMFFIGITLSILILLLEIFISWYSKYNARRFKALWE